VLSATMAGLGIMVKTFTVCKTPKYLLSGLDRNSLLIPAMPIEGIWNAEWSVYIEISV